MRTLCRFFCQCVITGVPAMVMMSSIASADDWFDQNWSLNGFGTLGYTQTNKYDERIPRRNITQSGKNLQDSGFLMDSRLGLQVKGQLTDHWEFVSQLVVREQFSHSLEDYIDIGFFRYRTQSGWQVGIGRQAFDLFFLSDHHNTSYSYDWIRPPTEFYGFMPYESFDGFKVVKNWGDFDNDWHWGLSVGNIEAKFDSDVLAESQDVDSLEANPIYSTELSWQTGQWQLRASYAILKFAQEAGELEELEALADEIRPIWPGFDQVVADASRHSTLRYTTLGAAWHHGDWKVQSEWSTIDSNFTSFKGQRAYFHVSKRWQDWQPFVSLGYAHDNQKVPYRKPPPDAGFDEFFADVSGGIEAMRHNQHSFTLGVRWDFARQKALKLQCDYFYFKRGSGSVHGRVDGRYRKDERRNWCSAAIDWVF
ncbi:MAG: hypothetical protein ACI8WB_001876 [Phenylobacterium sp.]|jgi:hypothetical protein